jgi:succinate-semialdehyde dehydrogenase / glutarate-semialdehyde dehydrogenase
MRPLVNEKRLNKVRALVDDAVAKGAKVLTGKAPKRLAYFFEPTVLGDVPAEAALSHDEIFGPVAPLIAFDTQDEAIAFANNTEYGLVS